MIAEGISMAIQSAWLLSQSLIAERAVLTSQDARRRAHREYERAWKRSFEGRIRVSAVIAHWAMRPVAVTCIRPWLRWFPSLLTQGARFSGKVKTLHSPDR